MFSPLPFFKENFLACLLILQARMCCGGGELYKFVRYALTVMWWLSPPNLIGRRKKKIHQKQIFFFSCCCCLRKSISCHLEGALISFGSKYCFYETIR